MFLISKGTTDTRGIGLLENLWKVVEALVDTGIGASLQFHGVLHGLRDGRAKGMAIMELNLAQEISIIDSDSLFLLLLDLSEAYYNADRDRLIHTLEGYGAGPCLWGLLKTFWDH